MKKDKKQKKAKATSKSIKKEVNSNGNFAEEIKNQKQPMQNPDDI